MCYSVYLKEYILSTALFYFFFAGYGHGYNGGVQPDYASKYHFKWNWFSWITAEIQAKINVYIVSGLGQGVHTANGKSGKTSEITVK